MRKIDTVPRRGKECIAEEGCGGSFSPTCAAFSKESGFFIQSSGPTSPIPLGSFALFESLARSTTANMAFCFVTSRIDIFASIDPTVRTTGHAPCPSYTGALLIL